MKFPFKFVAYAYADSDAVDMIGWMVNVSGVLIEYLYLQCKDIKREEGCGGGDDWVNEIFYSATIIIIHLQKSPNQPHCYIFSIKYNI